MLYAKAIYMQWQQYMQSLWQSHGGLDVYSEAMALRVGEATQRARIHGQSQIMRAFYRGSMRHKL